MRALILSESVFPEPADVRHSFDVGYCVLCREVLSLLRHLACDGMFAEFSRSGILFALGVSDLPLSEKMEDFSESNLNWILGNGNNLALVCLTV